MHTHNRIEAKTKAKKPYQIGNYMSDIPDTILHASLACSFNFAQPVN